MTRARTVIALCALAAIVAAGCGGDHEDSTAAGASTTARSLTKADYIAKSDAICGQANQTIRSLNLTIAGALQQGDNQAAANAVDTGLDRLRTLDSQIADLPMPAGDEGILTRLNAARAQSLALIEHLGGAFADGDNARVQRLTAQLDLVAKRTRAIAGPYGFQVCGQS